MITEKIGIKLFAAPATFPEGRAFIDVFHAWIRRKELGEVMIDVADYGHVEGGTSVYFCGHESDYVIDHAGGRPGLLYRRKRTPPLAASAPWGGSVLADGLARTFDVARRLEREAGLAGLTFATTELWIGLYDRARATNDDATFGAFEAETKGLLSEIFGGAVTLARASADPRELLAARVTAPATPLDALLAASRRGA